MVAERVEYDEFGLLHENAEEYGLPFDRPPVVRRERVEVEPGRSLSALVWGDGDPEIVLLHGGSQNAHTWDTVALALRPRPLVAIDLPGHGHSDGPGTRQLADRSARGAADDVAVVIRALAPNARGVVGMSFGGSVTIALTSVAPDLVRRAILVDSMPAINRENAQHIVDFVNGPVSFPSFDEILARTTAFNPTRSESSLRRGILHNAVQQDDGSWVWRHSRWRAGSPHALGDGPAPEQQAAIQAEMLEILEKIEVPILLARGMRPDSVLRDEDEAQFRRRQPSGVVERFEDAGHSIQGDMPLELAASIDAFMS